MKKMLIVSAQRPLVRVIRLGLESAGYEVDFASSGSECLLKLIDDTPDFLVTDSGVPQINGKELCLAIDRQLPDRKFPIVVLTSSAEPENRSWTHEIKNVILMDTPISVRRLLNFVRRTFDNQEQAIGT